MKTQQLILLLLLSVPVSGAVGAEHLAYDGQDRLTNANYGVNGTPTGTFNTAYSYDNNSNITALQRYDTQGLLSDFDYTYNGNQLTALTRKNTVGYVFKAGDTHYDGTVMPDDLLPIGLHFGDTVVGKDDVNPRRYGDMDTLYLRAQTDPEKYFSDADGDGVIASGDTLPLSQAMGLSYKTGHILDKNFGYLYDNNGNMTCDEFKRMRLYYNHLNLPDSIVIENRGKIVNTYLADGSLVRREEFNAKDSLLNRIDYQGLFVFEMDTLKYIFNDEGYQTADGKYYLNISDHLGNTRLVVNDRGNVIQRNSYYPYGMQIKALQFNNDFEYMSSFTTLLMVTPPVHLCSGA